MKKDKYLRVGDDPRALPDYIALRDELMKLSHPARPDVDWKSAGQLCLALFEHNGVDLQTAAWYTLARTHIAGLAGINEGLALINALTMYQWPMMWPGSTPARVEILTALHQRLQNAFRRLPLNDRDDLPLLYQTEKSLAALTETLARHELKQVCRLDVLQQQVVQAITRQENMPHDATPEAGIPLPEQAITLMPAQKAAEAARLVFVVRQEPPVQVSVVNPHAERGRARAFIAGAGSALIVGGLLLWGWKGLYASSPAQQQLAVSLTPLPPPLSAEQLGVLRQTTSRDARLVERTGEQLAWLMSLPPDWPWRYGQRLVSQSQAILPDDPAVAQMHKAWQQQIAASALAPASLNSWHNGMTRLQKLADRLNSLDEKRGKYMTVSELKSEVFAVTQAFNQYPPVEESLRLLTESRPENGSAEAQKRQSELMLRQLLARYALQTQAEGVK